MCDTHIKPAAGYELNLIVVKCESDVCEWKNG